jgi:hypothetical protein
MSRDLQLNLVVSGGVTVTGSMLNCKVRPVTCPYEFASQWRKDMLQDGFNEKFDVHLVFPMAETHTVLFCSCNWLFAQTMATVVHECSET